MLVPLSLVAWNLTAIAMADCIVVGAGLIGMLTARELARAGMQVVLLDKSLPAKESTWAGGGILSPLYPWRYPDAVSELARWSQEHYPSLCEALYQESGIDPEYTRSGLLITDLEESDDDVKNWATRFDIDLKIADADEVRELEPRLGFSTSKAAWFANVAQVRNPRLAKSLLGSLQRLGVNIQAETTVTGWIVRSGHVHSVLTTAGALSADSYVVCGGAWTGKLMESTGIQLPIEPVRGQMILFKGPPGKLVHITLHKGRYVIPRRDGHVLVGSTIENVGFKKETTNIAREDLYQSAVKIIPDLNALPITHHWAGLRPGSPEGIPVIGAHSQIDNLHINAGHFRNGVVLGPASVKVLTDALLGRIGSLGHEPYLPDNFYTNQAN